MKPLVQFACKYTHIRVYLYYCHYSFVFHKTLRIKTFVSLFIKFVHEHDEVKRKISTIVTNGRRKSNFCIHSLVFHYWLHYWLHSLHLELYCWVAEAYPGFPQTSMMESIVSHCCKALHPRYSWESWMCLLATIGLCNASVKQQFFLQSSGFSQCMLILISWTFDEATYLCTKFHIFKTKSRKKNCIFSCWRLYSGFPYQKFCNLYFKGCSSGMKQ